MTEQEEKGVRKNVFTKKLIIIIVALVLIIGAGAGVFLVKASDNPAFCSSCHIMQSYYQSWGDSNLLANKHANAGVTCHQCHESSVAVQAEEGIKFITGSYQTPLEKRDFGTKEFCLKCHDLNKVKTKTNFEESNPHDSHNGDQNCNLCHSMHGKSEVMCTTCHQFNWMNDLDGSWQKV